MNHSDSKLAHGTSGSPQMTFENTQAEQKAKDNINNVKQNLNGMISNKFPEDNQRGKTYKFSISNGRIKFENGIRRANFVIDAKGKIHLGNGHSFLANKNSVLAAGSIKVNKQGYVRLITNASGHYQPTIVEAIEYPTILKNAGINVEKSWINIYKFTPTKSGYVKKVETFYSGPIKYLRRRIK